jgi:hypothetical protein
VYIYLRPHLGGVGSHTHLGQNCTSGLNWCHLVEWGDGARGPLDSLLHQPVLDPEQIRSEFSRPSGAGGQWSLPPRIRHPQTRPVSSAAREQHIRPSGQDKEMSGRSLSRRHAIGLSPAEIIDVRDQDLRLIKPLSHLSHARRKCRTLRADSRSPWT